MLFLTKSKSLSNYERKHISRDPVLTTKGYINSRSSGIIDPPLGNDITTPNQAATSNGSTISRVCRNPEGFASNGGISERRSNQKAVLSSPGPLDKQRQLLARDLITVQTSTPELQGVLSKTRLYGPAHYKSSFEQVCEAEYPTVFVCFSRLTSTV